MLTKSINISYVGKKKGMKAHQNEAYNDEQIIVEASPETSDSKVKKNMDDMLLSS